MTATAATRSPFHCRSKGAGPSPHCLLSSTDIDTAAQSIAGAVYGISTSRGCSALLFVSPEMQVFVLSEERALAQQWLREHFAWFVGTYRPPAGRHDYRSKHLDATVDGIAEDLAEHLKDLAR